VVIISTSFLSLCDIMLHLCAFVHIQDRVEISGILDSSVLLCYFYCLSQVKVKFALETGHEGLEGE
jgi:hypothetical protein